MNVQETTRKSLSDEILHELSRYGMIFDNCRGHGDENGANMRGQHQGMQDHLIEKNKKEFFCSLWLPFLKSGVE